VIPSRARKPADRRQLLIDTARRLFSQRPYDQVTTSEIAKAAGMAYGLIAHYFENKRGLYLAVMNEIAGEIAAVHLDGPPENASVADQLRHALRSHITYIDSYGDSFVAFVRGNLGSDPQHRAAFDELRWQGVQRALFMLGIAEPVPPVLRTALRGWVCYFDEMMIDRITNRDVDSGALLELAVANLSATLQTAARLDSSIAIPPAIVEALNAFRLDGADQFSTPDINGTKI
jgi:AcrR family transcriptional regulator